MKTLVVLSALVSMAIAAPAQHGDGITQYELPEDKLPDAVKREKKSPIPDVDLKTNQAPGVAVNSPTAPNSNFEATGRSLGLKKPIIIKKKAGYHLYRDSDEEQLQADSQESCRQQVKVKLCDEENNTKSNTMRSSAIEVPDIHMSEHNMKHSIQLAKEAVENLQRDLKKIETKPSMKSALWEHADTQTDTEMHQDIEVARQALEHIHKNFGDLESMSLHATNAKDVENVHDVQFTMAKSEEERVAQWKEAIENIHKNVEIARNIEDTFKSETNQASFTKNNESDKNSNSKEAATCDDGQIIKTKNEKNSETQKIVEDDLKTSASSITEAKMQDSFNDKTLLEKTTLRNTPEQLAQSDVVEKKNTAENDNQHDKSPEVETATTTQHLLHQAGLSMKATDDVAETKPKPKELLATNQIKSTESDTLLDSQIGSGVKSNKSDKTEDKTQLKSAEHVETSHDDNNKDNEKVETQQGTEHSKAAVDTKIHSNMKSTLSSSSSSESVEKSTKDGKAVQNANLMSIKSADPMQSHATQFTDLKVAPSTNVEMKLVDTNTKHHQVSGPSDMRWTQDKNDNNQQARMKTTDGLMDSTKHTHFTDSLHHNPAMKNSNNFDTLGGQSFHSHTPNFHDNTMTHGKSAHMGSLMQSNFHMRDAVSEFEPENHMLRWNPPHETGRTAYGTGPANGVNIGGGAGGGAGAGAGAVGVFPNANIGSCGIPLLLSCSPSVVSGSLAKAHPAGYATPAYRTEDDFNFHTKRDVKKTNEIPATKVQRTPANIKLKTKTLDTKY